MRTLLIGALAAPWSAVAAFYRLKRAWNHAGRERVRLFRQDGCQSAIEPKPASFQTDSATIVIKSTVAAKTESRRLLTLAIGPISP